MDFLRRLAPPSVAAERSRATPVLAPRFAAQTPLRSVPVGGTRAPSDPDAGDTIAPALAAEAPHASMRRPGADAAPRADAGRQPAQRDATHAVRPLAARRPDGMATLASVAAPRLPVAAIPVRAGALRPRSDGVDSIDRVELADATTPAPARMPAAVLPAPAAARPLSQRALDARVGAAAPAPPIIHLTIDRIDVRAAAAPPRAPQATRRHATPSVPLADYLRGKGAT